MNFIKRAFKPQARKPVESNSDAIDATMPQSNQENTNKYFVEDCGYHIEEEIRTAIAWNDQIITAGTGKLRAWNIKGETASIVGHSNIVRVLIVWGKFFVSGSYDQSIVVWESPFTEHKRVDRAHTSWIYCFEIWKDNLISGSQTDVKIWNQHMHTLASLEMDAFQIKVLNQDYIFITGKRLHLWQGNNNSEPISVPHTPHEIVWTVIKYENGFLIGDYGKIRKITFSGTDSSVTELKGEHSNPVWAFGIWNHFFLSGSNATIFLHKPDGTPMAQWRTHSDWIRCIFRWKGRLVTAGDDGDLVFWKAKVDWQVIRLLHIAVMKPQNENCFLARLPREIIREIQIYIDPFNQ